MKNFPLLNHLMFYNFHFFQSLINLIRNPGKQIVVFLLLLIPFLLCSQYSISGRVVTSQLTPLDGAFIEISEENVSTYSHEDGKFTFNNLQNGRYSLQVSFIGYASVEVEVVVDGENIELKPDVILHIDPLELSKVVVTGSFNEKSKISSSIAVSTLSQQDLRMRAGTGTADLLRAIPGTFVDASAGDVFTRVYSRGISISAEDDLGWYYVSLKEDGLPVAVTQHLYYSPDFFHRTDLSTQRLEAIRGGSASITNSNAPGGTYNFISKTGGSETKGEVLISSVLHGGGKGLYRIDGNIGGSTSENGWRYNIGGFYRIDQGARKVDYNWSQGGQLKWNLLKTSKSGFVKLYAKYLNDKVNRWTGLAAKNWDQPTAAFGQDFRSTALMLPELDADIIDGRRSTTETNGTYHYNPGNGIRIKDLAVGLDFSQRLNNGWTIRNNTKFSSKRADWQTSIGNQPLGLEEFTPYILNGISPDFSVIPLGQIVFRDAQSNSLVASVNNLGILGPFSGEAPSFEYLEGSLPNDALMGIAPWKREDKVTEFMDQLTFQKQLGNHLIHLGSFTSYSNVKAFTSASFAYATFEPQPIMLTASLENPGEPVIQLSDASGISNYGGLFYSNGNAEVIQSAFFINDHWNITSNLNLDGGVRFEYISHQGEKDRSSPPPSDPDNRPETAYNNSTLMATGDVDEFDFKTNFLSYSLGLNYILNKATALFGRFTNGYKAPELNYYFNNFQNIPIPEAGTNQQIRQVETGLKLYHEKITVFSTAFWSRLDNINFSEFVFDQNTGELFFTPAQLNQTTSVGLELESILFPLQHIQIRFLGTIQKSTATQFTVYHANGSADETDHQIIDYTGNELPHNPKTSFEISPMYKADQWNAFFSWRFLGSRQANIANAFQLGSFSVYNIGCIVEMNKHWNVSLIINNLLNSEGLMNFFGPNEFGSNANAATAEYIAQHPDASFVVFPTVPRSIHIGIAYHF